MIKDFFLKFLIIYFIFFNIIKYNYYNFELNKNYIKYEKGLNLIFPNKIKTKIKIGIFTFCMKNGGRARVTSLLINELYKIKIFKIYLYTQKFKENNEYQIPKNIKRLVINNNNITKIFKNRINILFIQLVSLKKIKILNRFKNIKVIYNIHYSIFHFIYSNYTFFKSFYQELNKSYYIILLIPFENEYLFPKWRINSILMNNFITYNYNFTIPSNLSSKTILMIGRGNDKNKRFVKGIQSMEYIIQVINNCRLNIISRLYSLNNLVNLIYNLNLENNINFEGFIENPEKFFNDACLHLFPTITESFGLVLSETKIYGIPNILLGIDYISIAYNGTIIIYDDSPESLAKEAIKIILKKKYREKLGKESRKNMIKYNNQLLIINWVKLILSIYNGDFYYKEFKKRNKNKISEKKWLLILNNQIKLLKMRDKTFINITLNSFENFSFRRN